MTVFELVSACQFFQRLKIIRTNDYNEDYTIFSGTKYELVTMGMSEDVFASLGYSVLVIEHENDRMIIKCEDKYFWQSDKGGDDK